jgi:predicted kinase
VTADDKRSARLVVALMGLPGAGKSTVARHLLAELPLHLVDRDGIRAALFPRCAFTQAEKDAANAAVLAAVAANCRLGRASVVDGMTFARAAELEALRACAAAERCALLPLFLDCPVDVARARIAADHTHGARDRTPALADSIADRFEPPPADAVRIAADAAATEVCAAALAAVSAMFARRRNDDTIWPRNTHATPGKGKAR